MKLTLKQQVLGILALYLSVLSLTLFLRIRMEDNSETLEFRPLEWESRARIENVTTGKARWIEDFTLDYRKEYTLSRSSLEVYSIGIELKNWKIVRKSDGRLVGKQVFTQEEGVHFSWLSEEGYAYQGSGNENFSLYADIQFIPSETKAYFKFKQSPISWHWLPKAYTGPWINVENDLTGKDMSGLQENRWHFVD